MRVAVISREHPCHINEEYEPEDFVVCRVCGKRRSELAGHLRSHQMTAGEYREKFPGAPLICEKGRRAKSKGMTGVPHLTMRGRKRPEHSKRMTGENNPAKRPEVRKKISDNNSMNDPVNRAKLVRH